MFELFYSAGHYEGSYDLAGMNISCIVFSAHSAFCEIKGVHVRPEVSTLTYQCIQRIYNPQLHGMSIRPGVVVTCMDLTKLWTISILEPVMHSVSLSIQRI